MKRFIRRIIALALLTGALLGAGVVIYRRRIQPWLKGWGSTEEERIRSMPGDELVANANFETTRAVTIAAPPKDVWPWLVQIGQGRGGFYSYDLLENLVGLDMQSATKIDPSLQQLSIGDVIAVEPEGSGFKVLSLESNESMLLTLDGSGSGPIAEHFRDLNAASSWSFELTPLEQNRTRLVVRWRARYPRVNSQDPAASAIGVALEPVEFVMERKMLQGIRERAEIRSRNSAIDEFLPDFDYSEIRTADAKADRASVYAAAKQLTGHDLGGVLGSLLRSSNVPEKLEEIEIDINEALDTPILNILYEHAVVPLAEEHNREIVFGIVAELGKDASGDWPKPESPDAFRAFDDPKFGKLAVNILLQPGREPNEVLISSELRVHISDAGRKAEFGQYWPVVSFAAGLIQQQWLRAIVKRAEQGADE